MVLFHKVMVDPWVSQTVWVDLEDKLHRGMVNFLVFWYTES